MFASENYTEISNTTHKAAKVVDFDTCETTLEKYTKEFKAQGKNQTQINKELRELGLLLSPEDAKQLE